MNTEPASLIEALQQKVAALEQSEARLRLIADTAPVLLWQSGKDGLCNYFNQTWLDFTGRTLEQELGNGWAAGIHPDDYQFCIDTYQSALKARTKFTMEYRLKGVDGEYSWMLDKGEPEFTPEGNFYGYIGSCMDITAKKIAGEIQDHRLEETQQLYDLARMVDRENKLENIYEYAMEMLISGLKADRCGILLFDSEGLMRFAASRGLSDTYIKAVDGDCPWKPGEKDPKAIYIEDISCDKSLAGLSPVILTEGIHSIGFIPLISRDQIIGKFMIYYNQVHRYTENEKSFVRTIANDIAVAVDRKKSEDRVLAQHSLLTSLINSPKNIHIFTLDKNYCYTSFNESYSLQMKAVCNVDIKIGQNLIECISMPEIKRATKHSMDRTLKGEVFSEVLKQPDADIYYEYTWNPILQNGEVFGVTVFMQDITERRQEKEALASEKQRLASILEGTNAGTWEWNIKTGETIFNERWAAIIGYTLEELSPVSIATWIRYTHPDDLKVSGELLEKHFSGMADYYECEVRMKHKNGDWIWILDRGRVNEWDLEGNPLLMCGTLQDITFQKHTELKLQHVFALTEAALESIHNGILVVSHTGTVIKTNKKFVEMWQIPDEIVSSGDDETLIDFIRDQLSEPEKFVAGVNELYKKPEAESRDLIYFKDGRIFERFSKPMYLRSKVEGRVWSFLDITERKQAEVSKQEALDRLQKITRLVPGVIFQYRLRPDGTSCFPYVSESVSHVYQVQPEDLKEDASKAFNIVHPEDFESILKSIEVSAKELSPWQLEYRVKLKDGTIRWLYGNSVPQQEEDGSILWHGYMTDMTEFKKSEEKILQLSHVVEQSPVSIVITDTKGSITYVNQKFIEITGYSFEEAIGKNPRILKSGHTSPDEYRGLWKTLSTAAEWRGEFHNKKKNGELYWESATISPITNSEGKTTHFLAIKEDITDRKLAEQKLEKYAIDLKASNTQLENFAFVASHDLQEPLRMVISFLNLLEKKLQGKLDESSQQYIQFAVDGGKRMKILINDLLQYSRVGTNKEKFSATDLNEVLEYVTNVLKETINKKDALINVKPLPVIEVNKTLINDLFLNLINNSLKYHSDQQPEIEVGYIDEPTQYKFYVKDNGIGISPEYFDMIFIIFKRLHTKDKYSGTGIGLALCKKIVDIHKGEIWVESEEGKGSTFYFTIPK